MAASMRGASDDRFLRPRAVALDVDGHRQRRDVRREGLNEDVERGRASADGLGADASAFTASSSSSSSWATSASSWREPILRKSVCLAIVIAFSAVPPTPTPMTRGGHGLPPDMSTVSHTKSMTAFLPMPGRKFW